MPTTARNTGSLPAPAQMRVSKHRHHIAFNRALRAAMDEFVRATDSLDEGYDRAYQAVAREMGVSVAEVEAEVDLLRTTPSVLELSPMLVIDEYVLGLRTREDMIERLKTWPYTFSAKVYDDEAAGGELIGITASTWGQVEAAYTGGDIDQAAYDEISAAAELPAV